MKLSAIVLLSLLLSACHSMPPPAPSHTLRITAGSLVAIPPDLTFTWTRGQLDPNPMSLYVSDHLGTSLSVGTDQSWLVVTASSFSSPSNLTVSINTAGMPAGTYSGHVLILAPNDSNAQIAIPVYLTVH